MTVGNEDWKAEWDPAIAQIGNDLSTGAARPAAGRLEAGAVRKYLEPLESDCALHTDVQVARAHGHTEIIAPYTAISTFAVPAFWAPGAAVFTRADRNAQPEKTSVNPACRPARGR